MRQIDKLKDALVDMLPLARLGIVASEKSGMNKDDSANLWAQYRSTQEALDAGNRHRTIHAWVARNHHALNVRDMSFFMTKREAQKFHESQEVVRVKIIIYEDSTP